MAGFDALARRLPFDVDDYAAAGRAFAAWQASRDEADRETAALWAYCYVQRHLSARFARERTSGPADFDVAVSRAFDAVLDSFERIADPARFPAYVAVICKRAVLRHRESRRPTVEVTDDLLHADEPALPAPFADSVVRAAVLAALAALPPSLVEVARLRVLDGMDYEAIAAHTGRPLASVRTYAARAAARLREDPRLRAHFYDDLLPPGADGHTDGRFREEPPDF